MHQILILIISLLCLHQGQAESSKPIQKIPLKSKPLSALILFSGDYKTKLQFDGPFQQDLPGVFVESADFVSNKECSWGAHFQKVVYAKAPHLKITFRARCPLLNQEAKTTSEISLAAEYVRMKDLKTHSSSLYLSERYKNVQFKILEFAE